jgi:Rrf2 family protein
MSTFLGISQKCQYALRAMFELSLRYNAGTVSSVADIAKTQNIPQRFLEQIFSKLKSGGYIESRRGNQGGYLLAKQPSEISVGEVIRFVDDIQESLQCLNTPTKCRCQYFPDCVFRDLWREARGITNKIFDDATFQSLIDKQQTASDFFNYSI